MVEPLPLMGLSVAGSRISSPDRDRTSNGDFRSAAKMVAVPPPFLRHVVADLDSAESGKSERTATP